MQEELSGLLKVEKGVFPKEQELKEVEQKLQETDTPPREYIETGYKYEKITFPELFSQKSLILLKDIGYRPIYKKLNEITKNDLFLMYPDCFIPIFIATYSCE